MRTSNRSMLTMSAAALAVSLVLTGCGESLDIVAEIPPASDHDHDNGHAHGFSGRIVFTSAANDHVYVYDLESESVIRDFHLTGENAALYASPDYRFAVAIQRADGVVNFIDSGYETEAHGDHNDYHENDPTLLSFELFGELPTHYNRYDHRGVVFFDGVAGVPAKVYALSDHSLSENRTLASHEFTRNQQGAAEIRGNYLFTSYRSADTDGVLPDFVEVYERHSDHFDFIQRFEESCPLLNGSAITSMFVTFGCADGVLLISAGDDGYVAEKLANSEAITEAGTRVGRIYSHDDMGVFVGQAEQQLFWLQVEDDGHGHERMEPIEWRGEDNADASILRAGFNYSGNRFAILDSTGMLTVVRFRTDHYEIQSQFAVLDSIGENAPYMAFSPITHDAFISDPAAQELVIVDLHDGVIEERLSLDVVSGSLVWLGFLAEDDGHNH